MSRWILRVMLGCLVLIVASCICGVVVGGAGLNQGVQAVVGWVQGVAAGPYDLANRPLPTSPLITELLPTRLDGFNRLSISPVTGGGQIAVYASEAGQVTLRAAYYGSAGQANAQVSAIEARLTDGYTRRTYISVNTELSYLHVFMESGTVRLVWNHGGYFFDADASSEPALDAFMAAFPY